MLKVNQRDTAPYSALRRLVMDDASLQRQLAAFDRPDVFAAALSTTGAGRGIAVSPEAIGARLRPDPLALECFSPSPPDGAECPNGPWLPVHVDAAQAQVHWVRFGEKRLSEPFFSDTARQVQRLPFNRLFRYRQTLADFIAQAETRPGPDGFIFHMSRCGSTLAAQVIASMRDALVVSEAPPLDSILQIVGGGDGQVAMKALRAIVCTLGRRRNGERRYVVKLDAWHTLALPLFRRAFPDVPWVFLYREPIEVLVSQTRVRGIQTVPAYVPPSIFGLDTAVPDETYCAQVLAAICRAALDHYEPGAGLLVNYSELPEAVEASMLRHFGIRVAADEREPMRQAALRDAKAPGQMFVSDSQSKRNEASPLLHDLAARHLGAIYRSLERLRCTQR